MAKDKAKIVFGVESSVYTHIRDCETLKDMWEKIQKAYEDSGTRKVGLLRRLITTRLENCSSTEEYVNEILTTVQKLNGLEFTVEEECIGALLLAGLPDEYRPTIDHGLGKFGNKNYW